MRSINQALRESAQQLHAAGIDSAMHDARLLMGYAMNRAAHPDEGTAQPATVASSAEIFMAADDPEPVNFREWVDRRAAREPLQHIVGAASFYGLDFFSKPGVFIPRPETELLVEWALERIEKIYTERTSTELARSLFPRHIHMVDLCCGPGTILLAFAHACSSFFADATANNVDNSVTIELTGVERSPEALEMAEKNLRALRAAGSIAENITIRFISADITQQQWIVDQELVATADIIVSNPPYVPETSEGISPEVLADPHEAVFGGEDGMAVIPGLVESIMMLSAPRSDIAIEHDDITGKKVQDILQQHGLQAIRQHQDLNNRDRFVTGKIRRSAAYIPTYIPVMCVEE